MASLCPFVLSVLAMVAVVYGHRNYVQRLPNGDSIPNPCVPGSFWYASGHYNYLMEDGPINILGSDFAYMGHKWSVAFCRTDSDDDGRTNGQELGDPDCVWTPGATPAQNATGHPGGPIIALAVSVDSVHHHTISNALLIPEPGVEH